MDAQNCSEQLFSARSEAPAVSAWRTLTLTHITPGSALASRLRAVFHNVPGLKG